MPAKKLNLAPDVKSRLRRAVLGGINSNSPAAKSKPAAKPLEVYSIKPKPAAKALRKIVLNPPLAPKKPLPPAVKMIAAPSAGMKLIANKPDKKYMPESKSLVPSVKPAKGSLPAKAAALKAKKAKPKRKVAAAKAPAKPVVKIEKLTPPFPNAPQKIKPNVYKPFASSRRDWEKPQKEESLEKLFQGAKKRQAAGQADQFWKSSAEKKPVSPKSHFWLKLAGLIILLFAMVAVYAALGIYRYGFNDVLSNQVAKVLRLPAGKVNNASIGVSEYQESLKLLAQPLSLSREGLIDYSGKSDLSDRIFYRLAANELVSEKLQSYGKAVTQAEMDNQVSLLLEQTGGQAQAENIVKNLYGLSFDQFKELVLRPMIARASLQAAIISDETLPITQAAKAKAAEVLKLAAASSTDFAVLAKQYTDDESGINTGGDLGWVVKGQLGQAWEDAIFSAATGTVVSQPIKSGYGFHIVKVEQKLTDKATGAPSVKLRHILIEVNVDKYIADLLNSAKIVKYIK